MGGSNIKGLLSQKADQSLMNQQSNFHIMCSQPIHCTPPIAHFTCNVQCIYFELLSLRQAHLLYLEFDKCYSNSIHVFPFMCLLVQLVKHPWLTHSYTYCILVHQYGPIHKMCLPNINVYTYAYKNAWQWF